MKRKLINELIKWKTEDIGNPVLLTGAKGVGKTYLSYDFAKAFFERIYYVNFEREPEACKFILSNNSIKLSEKLFEYFHIDAEEASDIRLLILDEISYCKHIINYLNSEAITKKFPHIILISSNPVDAVGDNIQLRKLHVYPLEFDEFLRATSNDWYIELIINHFNSNKKIPEIVHKELITLHKLYLQIGGMPAMVNEYLNLSSAVNVAEQHSLLIGSYHDCILRDHPDSEALKMNQVFDSLLLQLIKDNKKFQYKLIRKGTTHSMYKDAIQKLIDYHFIIKCSRISTEELQSPEYTLQSMEWNSLDSNTNFKLYYPDTGLLYSQIVGALGISSVEKQYKALLENYVVQSLQAKNYSFAFWESDSMARIDFILEKQNEIIPIEIHASDNTRSKSISILKQKCEFDYAIKVSSKNFEFSNQVKYVPYYAVFCL